MSARERLLRIATQLDEEQAAGALRLLESLTGASGQADPLLEMLLQAPEVDEPLTAEERAALGEAIEQAERGETAPWREIRDSVG